MLSSFRSLSSRRPPRANVNIPIAMRFAVMKSVCLRSSLSTKWKALLSTNGSDRPEEKQKTRRTDRNINETKTKMAKIVAVPMAKKPFSFFKVKSFVSDCARARKRSRSRTNIQTDRKSIHQRLNYSRSAHHRLDTFSCIHYINR